MSVIIWSIVAYLTNRPKKTAYFLVYSGENRRLTKILSSILVNRGRYRSRQATAPRRNIAPPQKNDTRATLSRQFGDSVAWVSHWEYRDKSRFPSFAWRTKKPRLRNSFTASEALSAKRGNDTCPYIPAWLISPRLSVPLWDLPPADSTSPCAAAWDRSGRTARSALGAPSNIAGSRSDSR